MYAAKALCVVHVMCSRSRSGHNRSNDRNGGSAAKYEVAIELERVVFWDRNHRYTTGRGTYKWRSFTSIGLTRWRPFLHSFPRARLPAPDRSAIAGSFTFSARLQLGSVHGYSSGLSCLSCDLSSAALA